MNLMLLATSFVLLLLSHVYSNTVPMSDASLNRIHGDPMSDCLQVKRCTNCRGTGGRAQFRTMDGTCNNLFHPLQGASMTRQKRSFGSEYLPGTTGFPRGFALYSNLKSPHTIARNVFQSVSELEGNDHKPHKTSILFMVFGQFIDHNIVATGHSKSDGCPVRCAEGSTQEFIYPCNPLRKVETTTDTNKCTKLTRTKAACNDPLYPYPHREQVNRLSSYIDGSAVYGSSDEQAWFLRTKMFDESIPNDGKLRVSSTPYGDLLPDDLNLAEPCNGPDRGGCFAAGDDRSGEHIGLAAMHTLWVREHNRIAGELKKINSHWSGSKIYYTARRIVIAEIQSILLKEWLPLVTVLENQYFGYNEYIDASVSNAFANAAYRFGHSLVPNILPQKNNNFENTPGRPHIPLREAFFNTKPLRDHGIESTVYGMIANQSEAVDTTFAEAIARHLFIPLGQGGLEDLSAINIHRGRDHGLPPYTKWREWCNLETVTWNNLHKHMSQQTVDNLKKVYDSVDDIDLFVGGISEFPVTGKVVGKTFGCIIARQFDDIFRGDRYFFTSFVFDRYQSIAIRQVKMRQILCDNLSDVVSLQDEPFLAYNEELDPRLRRRACAEIPYDDPLSESLDLELWREPPY